MASETSFSVVGPGGGLGSLWRGLGELWFFGWLGNPWFSTLADTEAGRSQIRLACTFDLASNEITRHGLPGGQGHREVPYALW